LAPPSDFERLKNRGTLLEGCLPVLLYICRYMRYIRYKI